MDGDLRHLTPHLPIRQYGVGNCLKSLSFLGTRPSLATYSIGLGKQQIRAQGVEGEDDHLDSVDEAAVIDPLMKTSVATAVVVGALEEEEDLVSSLSLLKP
jgi:hypothetical protein